ncbi:MAG: AI-2E family transporter [Bacteroidetes bacterium]|jgi:predicted PurR-regulated permease PerM|nr:AI-2E family transporter [Bacteroidota bacterium]
MTTDPSGTTSPPSDPDPLSEGPRPARQRAASGWTLERGFRVGAGIATGVLLVGMLWYFSALVIYLIVGSVLAYLVRPIVDRVQGLGLHRILAILVTFVLFFGTLSLLLTYLVPFIGAQLQDLSQQVSSERITQAAAFAEAWLRRFVPIQTGEIEQALTESIQTLFRGERITEIVSSMVNLFADIFYAVLVVPFVMFFVLKDGSMLRRSLLQLVPNRYFEVTLAIIEKVETNIGRYFRGLMLQCLSIAAVATLLLYVVGLDYALAVGLFAGLANTIPYFGPLMGFIAGTLVGITQTGDFTLIPGVLVAMTLTQIADNVFFQPLIFSRAARAHPLVILFVVLIGAQLAGIIGMLLAIPITTILRVTGEQVLWSLRNYRILRAS